MAAPRARSAEEAAADLLQKAKPDDNSCLICHKAVNKEGYPTAMWGGRYGYNIHAHRLIYQTAKGPIPQGQVVRHKCDNRQCINIEHLELGTVGDNNRDTRDRGRGRNQHGAYR